MSYQVLARKYRPASFKELEGQEHVLQALVNALESNRLHHAYLFTGTRGVGKTTIARILAKCLNCEAGVTATPCGACNTCLQISEGRSVDLIEVDAASRTGVDDMRELLDNVQYMPTASRFKIYLIDEVHMLSRNSFNAMLKTLEEPPEHVKFLFATTDPKKLPVTVLSRCLQFNLKNLSPERVVNYLKLVLGKEEIEFEEPALWQLGRAADGSMRDALSLTDQAISFSEGKLTDTSVKSMLGSIDQREVYELLDGLVTQNAAQVLARIEAMAEYAPDYASLVDEILGVLHRVAVGQSVPDAVDNSQGDKQLVMSLADSLSPEDVQLYYQIALVGKRDLTLAPDQRSGFEMLMLRILGFQRDLDSPGPTGGEGGNEKPSGKKSPIAELLNSIGKDESPAPSASAKPEHATESGNDTKSAANTAREVDSTVSEKTKSTENTKEAPLAQAATPPAPEAEVTESQEPSPTASLKAALDAIHQTPADDTPTPETEVETSQEKTAPEKVEAEPRPAIEPVKLDLADNLDWHEILEHMNLVGVTRTLAANCTLDALTESDCELVLAPERASLWNESHENRIAGCLAQLFGQSIRVSIKVAQTEGETPADIARRELEDRQARAVNAIENDQNIQTLIESFNGVIDPESIAPLNQGERT